MARESPSKQHIVLIGMRGSGKTTIGRLVAAALGRVHIDTDDLVADTADCSITEIFTREGEAGFRKREREAIATAASQTPAVISVGGGAVLDVENRRVLREFGHTVWLTAPVAVLHERIQADKTTPSSRPPLSDLSALAEVEALLREREPLYRAAADVEVDTACQSLEDAVTAIVQSVSHGERKTE